MKKIFNWTVIVSLIFIAASAVTYTIHYLIFKDPHHIFIYMIGDFGFLFIDVLLVVLLIERILSRREKRSIMKKLNMVIGTFFSEVGLEFLKRFSFFVQNSGTLSENMMISPKWKRRDYEEAIQFAHQFSYDIQIENQKLCDLRDFLVAKRNFMLRMLENPNLLEHERFTDLLWAVFHLTEELAFRDEKLLDLPKADVNHLANDLKRAYSQITGAWISYVQHLKESYPFLFSLAIRINPMDPNASPTIME